MLSLPVSRATAKRSAKRKSREQRLAERARTTEDQEPLQPVMAETGDGSVAGDESTLIDDTAIQHVEATPAEEPGLVEKLVGGGAPEVDGDTGLVHYRKKPGFLRPLARRAYERDATLASIRRGFDDLTGLMADIRDGLDDSVVRQGDLLDQLKWLPTVAKQNADSAQRLEEQFKSNTSQLAKSNELAGEHLRVQSESLRTQAESVKALRDQILGQRQQSDKLNDVLGKMTRESRDQKRDVDDMQERMDKMRQSDQSIADNLGGVAGAIRHVSQQTAAQGEVITKMQAAIDERTKRLEVETAKRSKTQGLLITLLLTMMVALLAGLATLGYLYLRANDMLPSFLG
jgi:DNA repair exonuclease SbcCD ATPase subunit